ncbi:hypothetical protein [Actinomyces howellii]|uniref:Uncharacterized protein n=1 Tax=Actinomyces howellii TaxID=52771 RepID=A0A448HI49_9ACTO|nr:hypothetical protein [Actinomyces howellii]VEG29022.1 Uncharacterised protein [Actinomyces howellii]
MLRRGFASATGLLVLIGVLVAGPAAADSYSTTDQSSDGSATITVSVSYTSAAAVSGGGGGGAVTSTSTTVTATVQPICWHTPLYTGKSLAETIDQWPRMFQGDSNPDDRYPGWREHVNDENGHWYVPVCSSGFARDMKEFHTVAEQFFAENDPVWVPAGGEPPAPYIDGATLAQAAWDAVDIPSPTVDTNPRIGESGATLVGFDTWVWATGETPSEVTATATAGPVTATVRATSVGMRLSAPDSEPSCQGFGTAWQSGLPEGASTCTIVFTRSSAHLGGTTPMDVSVSYSASFTATDGATGDLGIVTTSSTVDIPVAEVQTLTTSEG